MCYEENKWKGSLRGKPQNMKPCLRKLVSSVAEQLVEKQHGLFWNGGSSPSPSYTGVIV